MPIQEVIVKSKVGKEKKKYYFSTYYTNIMGERKRYKSKKYDDKKLAIKAEAEFIVKQGSEKINSTCTFESIYNEYYTFQKTKVRKTTYDKYEDYYRYIGPYLGNAKISELTLSRYQQWYNFVNEKDFAISYKNKIFQLLKSLIKYAETFHGVICTIPAKFGKFKDPSYIKPEMDYFTFEEFLKFITVADNNVYRAFYTILYYMGLRQGEAQALYWKDINFITNTIKITKTLTTKIKGEDFTFSPPKTTRSKRELIMPEIVRETLLELKAFYESLDGFSSSSFVFGMLRPLPENTIRMTKIRYCNKAGVKEIRIHDFRHSFASFMINNGADASLVSKYLGHSNIAETMNTYSHLFPSKQQEIIDIINEKVKKWYPNGTQPVLPK